MSATTATLRDDARVIGLVGLAHGVSHFFQLAIPSLFPWMRDEFGVSWTALALVTTVFFAVSGVAQAAAGFAVDRFGARRMLIAGFALMVAGMLLAAAAPGVPGLMAAAVLIGLGNSVFHPADFAILNTRVSAPRLGHAFSVHGLTGNLGYVGAPLLMVAVAGVAGWRVALLCAALVGALMLALVLALPGVFRIEQGPHRATPAAAGSGRFGWLNGSVLGFFLFFAFVTATGVGIQNFAPQVLRMLHGVGAGAAAGALTAYLLAAAFGMAVGGFVAGRVQRQENAAAGSLVLAAGLLIVAASGALGFAAAAVLICVTGFLMGVVGPLRDMLVRRAASAGAMGKVYGVIYSGIDVGAAVGPAVVGLCLDAGRPGLSWVVLAGSLLVAAALSWTVSRRMTRLAAARAA